MVSVLGCVITSYSIHYTKLYDYEMLTGRLPFAGEDASAALHAILFENPRRPESRAGEVPKSLVQIIGLCLAKDPSQRYQSAGELLEDLERTSEGVGPFV